MKLWLLKHKRILDAALGLAIAMLSGTYINLLTSLIMAAPGQSVGQSIMALKWWNILLLLTIACLGFMYYLGGLQSRLLRSNLEQVIHEILAAASRSIIYPSPRRHIPPIITLYDKKNNVRKTRFSYNAEPDPERTGVFPADFGITGKAFSNRCVVIEELAPAHHAGYSEDVKSSVLPQVRTIIAAPLLHSMDRKATPLGVLAFDSMLEKSKLVKDEEEMRHVAQKWADVIASLLVITGEG